MALGVVKSGYGGWDELAGGRSSTINSESIVAMHIMARTCGIVDQTLVPE